MLLAGAASEKVESNARNCTDTLELERCSGPRDVGNPVLSVKARA
jgi:hypothetical protein